MAQQAGYDPGPVGLTAPQGAKMAVFVHGFADGGDFKFPNGVDPQAWGWIPRHGWISLMLFPVPVPHVQSIKS